MDRHTLPLFVDGLRSVMNCMSKDNSRYAISGVLVESGMGGVRLIATDGHRLALALVPDVEFPGLTQTILPSSAVKAMTGRAKSAALDIQITIAGSVVKTGAGSLQFEAVEGNFPPYRDVIPSQVAPGVVVPTLSPTLLETTTSWSESKGFRLFATRKGNSGPVLVLDPANPNWLAIIMPVNVEKAGIWTEEDGKSLKRLTGKNVSVLEPGPMADTPAVAGTVGAPARQAA